ncbi:MAG: hypothetical protein LQ338_007489, partial [Usnochroma carphineum]
MKLSSILALALPVVVFSTAIPQPNGEVIVETIIHEGKSLRVPSSPAKGLGAHEKYSKGEGASADDMKEWILDFAGKEKEKDKDVQ